MYGPDPSSEDVDLIFDFELDCITSDLCLNPVPFTTDHYHPILEAETPSELWLEYFAPLFLKYPKPKTTQKRVWIKQYRSKLRALMLRSCGNPSPEALLEIENVLNGVTLYEVTAWWAKQQRRLKNILLGV